MPGSLQQPARGELLLLASKVGGGGDENSLGPAGRGAGERGEVVSARLSTLACPQRQGGISVCALVVREQRIVASDGRHQPLDHAEDEDGLEVHARGVGDAAAEDPCPKRADAPRWRLEQAFKRLDERGGVHAAIAANSDRIQGLQVRNLFEDLFVCGAFGLLVIVVRTAGEVRSFAHVAFEQRSRPLGVRFPGRALGRDESSREPFDERA